MKTRSVLFVFLCFSTMVYGGKRRFSYKKETDLIFDRFYSQLAWPQKDLTDLIKKTPPKNTNALIKYIFEKCEEEKNKDIFTMCWSALEEHDDTRFVIKSQENLLKWALMKQLGRKQPSFK